MQDKQGMFTNLETHWLCEELIGKYEADFEFILQREAWTIEEEHALINAHRIYGNRWAEIAKVLPRRYRQTTCILLG